jgi:hypothetical protein
MPDAGSEAVTHQVADQPGFAVNDLQGAFVTTRNTKAASIAKRLINFYHFSYHHISFWLCVVILIQK